MQPQLFLFDEEPGKVKEEVVPGAPFLSGKNNNDADEAAAERATHAAPAEESEVEDNPFAAVQQQQQDKVDMMLLMPNRKRGRKSFRDMDNEAILIAVPEDEELFKKQYYQPGTVAEWFGISASQLRNWDIEFDILKPKKNAKGDRYYRPEDVKNLKLIYHLIRVRKFTVQGAKQYMAENKKRLQTVMQLTESLSKFRQFLLELKAISG